MRPRTEGRAAHGWVELVIVFILCLLIGPSLAAAAPKPPGSGLAKILTPRDGGLAALRGDREVRVRIRTSSRVQTFEAHLGPKEVTSRFSPPRRGVRTARLSLDRGLRRGPNHLNVVTTARDGRSDFDHASFIVARRRDGLLSLSAESRFSPRRLLRAVSRHRSGIDRFRARLNGRPVSNDFAAGSARRRQARLDVDAGLRYGRNVLVITVVRNGRFDRERYEFTVRRTHPLVGAGRDRTTFAGDRVKIDGTATRPARRSQKLSYHWRVVKRPRGSRGPVLRSSRSATPRFVPDVNGHFELELTVRRRSARKANGKLAAAGAPVSRDTVGVASQIDAPPVGVPIETIPLDGGGINFRGRARAASASGVQMLVLDRRTLAIKDVAAFDYDELGLTGFTSALDVIQPPTPNGGGQILVLTGAGHASGSIPSDWVDTLKRVYEEFGGDLSLFPSGSRNYPGLEHGGWSLIGVHGMQSGQAAQSWEIQPPGGHSQPGGLEGHFRLDQHRNWAFVPSYDAGFDTNLPGQPPNRNQIRVDFPTSFNHWTYTSEALPDGQSGFHVLVLRQGDLGKLGERTFATNNADGSQIESGVGNLATYLDGLAGSTYPPLVIVQSIGSPKPASSTWTDSLTPAITMLGGTADVFNATKPDRGGYTLVGGLDLGGSGAEASTAVTGLPSRLHGMLRQNQQSQWVGYVSEPTGGANYLMYEIVSQGPTEWPASQTEGQRQAMSCIAGKWNPTLEDTTDVRANYWKLGFNISATALTVDALESAADECDQGASFGPASCTESGMPAPGVSGDVAAVFCALNHELPIVRAVNAYFLDLRDDLLASQFISAPKIGLLGHDIAVAVQPPPKDTSAEEALSIVSDILLVGAAFVPLGEDVPEAGGALAASLDLAADLTTEPDGNNSLSETVEASAYALGAEAGERFGDVYNQMPYVRNLLVGDYGKLTAAGARVASEWDTTDALDDFMDYTTRSAEQWFYATLMSVAYEVWDVEIDDPRNCYVSYYGDSDYPFTHAPAYSWWRYVAGFSGGTPVVHTKLIGTGLDWEHDERPDMPPPSVTRPLFDPSSVDSSGNLDWVGAYSEWFLNEHFTISSLASELPPGCFPGCPAEDGSCRQQQDSAGHAAGESARPSAVGRFADGGERRR